MKFNKSKCRGLHLGWGNTKHKYKLGEDWLESSPAERALECWWPAAQHQLAVCAVAAKGENCILGCITA